MNFTFKQIIAAGGPVLFALAILSVYSIALIWERRTAFKKILTGTDPLLKEVRRLLKSNDAKALVTAAKLCAESKSPAGEIMLRSLSGHGTPAEKREASEKAVEWHASGLQKGLTVLATIGSTSPFVGLFGTVIGVMRAFKDLAAYSGAGPSVVASGIAEALVNTAAGLFVAIPAIAAYNYFVYRANQFVREMDWVTEQIIDKTAAKTYSRIYSDIEP